MELASRRRNRTVAGLALVAAVYWLAMFVGTHLPISDAPPRDPDSLDKWLHAAAFAGLAVLLAAVGRGLGFRTWRLYACVVVVVALYGLFDEATQALVRRREPDLFDWLADVAGALVGIAAFALAAKFWTEKQRNASGGD
jgi:VanZ family protein